MTQPLMFYGLLTVRLEKPPATDAEALKQIGKALGIAAPHLDEELGILHGALVGSARDMEKPGERNYVVGVESVKLRALMTSGNPNVVGCMHSLGYSETGKPVFLKNPPAPPHRKHKGPGL